MHTSTTPTNSTAFPVSKANAKCSYLTWLVPEADVPRHISVVWVLITGFWVPKVVAVRVIVDVDWVVHDVDYGRH